MRPWPKSRRAKSDVPDDIASLLADLSGRGIHLRLENGALKYAAPPGALTPDIRARLQAAKSQTIEHLRQIGTRPLPASLTQRRFYALQQIDPDWSFYNVPFLFRLTGLLDPDKLRRASDAIVARHDSLRTTLHERDGALVQIVADTGETDWTYADMRGAPPEAADALLRHDMRRRFDCARDKMLRATLVRVADDAYLFQICLHNVVFDMASLLTILDELSAHYAEHVLPPPVQYAEYTRWQAARIAAGMDRRRAYWTEWFAKGPQPAWSWPEPTSPPAQAGFDSLPTWARLAPDRNARLQAFCRSCGVTPYVAVLTAYLCATRDLTGCNDLTIGTTYSDRDDHRFASMIGASVMVPALRVDMTDDPGFPALLRRVRDVVASALANQDLPAGDVVPNAAKGPLFKLVCSAFPETPHGRLRLPGIRASWVEERFNPISRPTLYLVVWETPTPTGNALTCHMMHRQDVWDAGTADRTMRTFEAILGSMAD
jgi:hypothetical protein